jgi:hypothetical protein
MLVFGTPIKINNGEYLRRAVSKDPSESASMIRISTSARIKLEVTTIGAKLLVLECGCGSYRSTSENLRGGIPYLLLLSTLIIRKHPRLNLVKPLMLRIVLAQM